jgi:outer membrane protein TolC
MRNFMCAAGTFFLCAGFVWAQQEAITPQKRKISVEEAVELALKNNLSLQASKITMEKTKRPSDLSWNQFLPVVAVSGSLSGANKAAETKVPAGIGPGGAFVYTTSESPRWGMNGAFQIQWQKLNIAMFEGIKQLKQTYETGQITYQKAKFQLERDIRKLYASLSLAQESLFVQEQSLALAEEQVRTAGENYRAGLSPELTLMQARLNRDNLIPVIDQARNNMKVSMANLAVFMGLPYDTGFDFGSVERADFSLPLDMAMLINEAASRKIEIQELRATIAATRTARNAMRYQLWTPSVDFGWSYAPVFNGDPFKDDWTGSRWNDRGALSLSLSWSLNGILPFTTQASNLRDMEDTLRGMDVNLAQLINATEVEVYNTVFLISQARESVAAQLKTVELAQKTYEDTLAAFRAGLRDFLEVQNVEQQLRQAQLGVLQQQFNFLSGIIDLEYAICVPFGTLLNQ